MRREEYKAVKDSSAFRCTVGNFAKALFVSLAVTAIVFALAALLLTYTPLPESLLGTVVIFTAVLAVVCGAAHAAHGVGSRGWLTGAIAGALYSVVLYFISSLAGDGFSPNGYFAVFTAVNLFSGAAGGILGINLPGKRKRS